MLRARVKVRACSTSKLSGHRKGKGKGQGEGYGDCLQREHALVLRGSARGQGKGYGDCLQREHALGLRARARGQGEGHGDCLQREDALGCVELVPPQVRQEQRHRIIAPHRQRVQRRDRPNRRRR